MNNLKYQIKVVGQENIYEITSKEHILDSLSKKKVCLLLQRVLAMVEVVEYVRLKS